MSERDSIAVRTDTLAGTLAYQISPDSLAPGEPDSIVYHGFSVWRIAQQMGDCTPQQLDSAIQANLPQREHCLSERPDTLSLPGLPGRLPYEAWDNIADLYGGFFNGNPLLHPELPYRSHGESAIPIPYSLQRDNLVTSGLILCLIMMAYVINKTGQKLKLQTKTFFHPPKEQKGIFNEETSIEGWAHLFSVLQLCLMGSLTMFAYSQNELQVFLGQLSPRWLLGIYMTSFLAFFLTKRLMSAFINWIFFPKSQQKFWKDTCSYLLTSESIIFFPLLLTFVYFRFPFENMMWIFLFILLISKILLTFKAHQIFFPKSYGTFHLFAYLCALEIMPLLALWKTLAIVTENLIVKY